jgi:hypothetical protein
VEPIPVTVLGRGTVGQLHCNPTDTPPNGSGEEAMPLAITGAAQNVERVRGPHHFSLRRGHLNSSDLLGCDSVATRDVAGVFVGLFLVAVVGVALWWVFHA